MDVGQTYACSCDECHLKWRVGILFFIFCIVMASQYFHSDVVFVAVNEIKRNEVHIWLICILDRSTYFHSYFFIIKPTRCTNFTNVLSWNYMFRTVPLSVFGSLFTVHSAMVYVVQVCRQLLSRSICSCSKAVWHIPLLYSVQWINSCWWTGELSETCRVSCQNKFVKLVHLISFIIKKFVTTHCRSRERKTRVGDIRRQKLNINLQNCAFLWFVFCS
jgi:hypothetical protein